MLGIMIRVEDLGVRTCGTGEDPVVEEPPLVALICVVIRIYSHPLYM